MDDIDKAWENEAVIPNVLKAKSTWRNYLWSADKTKLKAAGAEVRFRQT